MVIWYAVTVILIHDPHGIDEGHERIAIAWLVGDLGGVDVDVIAAADTAAVDVVVEHRSAVGTDLQVIFLE